MAFNDSHNAVEYLRMSCDCEAQTHRDAEPEIKSPYLCVSALQNGFPKVKKTFNRGSGVPSGLVAGLKFIPKSRRAGPTGV